MASLLKIVATPIGNTRDISLRAMNEIENADVIFAEDTRHSQNLVHILGLKLKADCRWISCPAAAEKQRVEALVERLQKNDRVLFMSDAGCPTISDPGSLMVKAVLEKGFGIEVIPGASAHSAALMGAGIDTTRFAFLGFLPQKKIARQSMIVASANAGLALVIYESPLRVNELLAELHAYLGERRVVVARELTKTFESFHRGVLGHELAPSFITKGECVVVVEAGDLIEKVKESIDANTIEDFIAENLAKDIKPKELAQMVAIKFQIKKKVAYDKVVALKSIDSLDLAC